MPLRGVERSVQYAAKQFHTFNTTIKIETELIAIQKVSKR
jgi:hypothetical protein